MTDSSSASSEEFVQSEEFLKKKKRLLSYQQASLEFDKIKTIEDPDTAKDVIGKLSFKNLHLIVKRLKNTMGNYN